ncbi:MAG: DegT/DnrJ/EryC1/StrS family aminotransferase [Phycisphaerae bacterium]
MKSPSEKIEFFRHDLGFEEKERIVDALDSLVLTTGDAVHEMESALATYLGVKHVVGLNSCTAALHLSLIASGIGPGDEVIVPAMTFIATANAVLMAGATPVFADVDPSTGCLTPETAACRITKRTKAIIPVHLYGLLCDMKALRTLADDHKLYLIEDSAHCLEATRHGVRPGCESHAACFSFYATKAITCGEGGALATNDSELAERVRRLSLHGMTTSAFERHAKPYQHWDMAEFGWKYNLDNVRASLLLPQIARLDRNCVRRRCLALRYEDLLGDIEGVELPGVANEMWSARHLMTIWVDPNRRDDLLGELQNRGIGVAVNYRPVHLMAYYRKRFGFQPGDFPNAERIGARTISLPLYPQLSEEEVERVAGAVATHAHRPKGARATELLGPTNGHEAARVKVSG